MVRKQGIVRQDGVCLIGSGFYCYFNFSVMPFKANLTRKIQGTFKSGQLHSANVKPLKQMRDKHCSGIQKHQKVINPEHNYRMEELSKDWHWGKTVGSLWLPEERRLAESRALQPSKAEPRKLR